MGMLSPLLEAMMKPTDFAKALSHYLSNYLPGQRNVSPNTIKSYRDTFKLLLTYCKQCEGIAIEKLYIRHIDKPFILNFLGWLENDRNNGISTRNQRLACLHGFFRYLQIEALDGLLSHQQVLSIPMKKTQKPMIIHLTPDALKCILAQPDLTKSRGRRDLTLLSLLYDSGARVQEIADLQVGDVRLDPPPILTLTGKGNKKRQIPLMGNTELLLTQYMREANLLINGLQTRPLFINTQRRKMTRAGIAFILDKYVTQARATSQLLPDKVTPHIFRHTKAMHLLQAGVNKVYIRDLLGHVDEATTEIYAHADTELKRKALEKAYPNMVKTELPEWTKDDDLLIWLDSL
jgi:site-specific recombinase XerD